MEGETLPYRSVLDSPSLKKFENRSVLDSPYLKKIELQMPNWETKNFFKDIESHDLKKKKN